MWSETVGLQDRSETKKLLLILVLVLHAISGVVCCVVKHGLVMLVIIVILKDRHNYSSTNYGFSILCFERHYCGYQQWRLLS